jgi:hypothetical protein
LEFGLVSGDGLEHDVTPFNVAEITKYLLVGFNAPYTITVF